jgi:hypothetical protein
MFTSIFRRDHRFFSVLSSRFKAEDFLKTSFLHFVKNTNQQLKANIILNHLSQAKMEEKRFGQLALRDAALPLTWNLKKKLDFIYASRSEFFARPVLTAHPTEVLSDEIQIQIQYLLRRLLKIEELQEDGRISQQELFDLQTQLKLLLSQSFLPLTHLSPEQEMVRQDRLYLDMMASWPKFNATNLKAFAQNHGIERSRFADVLTQANKFSYQNVGSWSIADIDGNQRRNRQTMEKMESSLQIAIIERYLRQLEPLQAYSDKLNSVVLYLKRCQQSIEDGIYFNLQGAAIAKKRLIKILTELKREQVLSPSLDETLDEFIAFVDLVGFRGDLKQFVRQSSQVNADVLQNFIEILQEYSPQIKSLSSSHQHYKYWPQEAKTQLHHLFRTDSGYFKYIKQNKQRLSKSTMRELDILDFVREYQDQFSYILSDTKDYHSLDAVVILFGFSAYCSNKLYIDDIKRPPVNLIPLCETPEDLAKLEDILDAMLKNPYLKQVMMEKGELVYVAGPSDLGKEGGVFAHFDLIEAEKKARQILKKHQRLDTHLNMVELRVLYGLGGDFHRRVSDASSQLFCTFQGSDACQLGGVSAYQAYVETVSGQYSENTLRALALGEFELKNPQGYQQLKKMVTLSIAAYRDFIFAPASLNLFRKLSMPHQLGALMNTSSRAESKTSLQPDICKSRAIGIANYEISSLFFMRIFMGLDGLVDIPPHLQAQLPEFYQASLVIKELVMKIFFAFAISREDLAIQKIFKQPPSQALIKKLAFEFKDSSILPENKTEEHALAYILNRKLELFKVLLAFMPSEQKQRGWRFLESYVQADMSNIALGLLKLLGDHDPIFKQLHSEISLDLLPKYQLLQQCLEDYHLARKAGDTLNLAILEENVVLALRGDKRISSGPKTIAKMSMKPSLNYDVCYEKDEESSCLMSGSSILKK